VPLFSELRHAWCWLEWVTVVARVQRGGVIGGQESRFLVDFFLRFSTSLSFVLALLSRKTVVSLLVLPMFAVALRTVVVVVVMM